MQVHDTHRPGDVRPTQAAKLPDQQHRAAIGPLAAP